MRRCFRPELISLHGYANDFARGCGPSILAGFRASLRGRGAPGVPVQDSQELMEDGSVRFDINVGATSRARLKVSSKLLSLVRVVTGAERSATN